MGAAKQEAPIRRGRIGPPGPSGPNGAPEGLRGYRRALEGPYLSRVPIRHNRVICGDSSGPIVPNQDPDKTTSTPTSADMARWDLTNPDGCLDGPVWVND